jgi:hypothetical protein
MQGFILFILDINAEVKRVEGFIVLILDINTEVKRIETFIPSSSTSTQRSRGWRDSSSSS